MSSGPLMMDYEGGDLLLAGAACAGYWAVIAGRAVSEIAVWRASFSDVCALAVPGAWNALYKSTSLPFYLFGVKFYKFYSMDLVNDERTTKRDPRNARALGQSKLRSYFRRLWTKVHQN